MYNRAPHALAGPQRRKVLIVYAHKTLVSQSKLEVAAISLLYCIES